MDQVAILEKLEKVADLMRRGGMHRLTRLGRDVTKSLLREELSVNFEGLSMSGSIELRGLLYLSRSGQYEPFTSQLFKEAVRPDSIVLDIGACLGYYTLLAANLGAKVYAFEPDSNTGRYLLTNIKANNFCDRVVVVAKAVSDKNGTIPFFIHDSAGMNSVFRDAGDVKEKVQVGAVTIDECFHEAAKLSVIKMDIEGAEGHALAGMTRTIALANDLKMFVECNGPALRSASSSPERLVARLRNVGFRVMVIDDKNRRLLSVPSDIDTLNKQINLYCERN